MAEDTSNTRNEAIEFARRTRKNLQFIEDAKVAGADVHIVTQLTLSLLGMIVIPREKLFLDEINRMPIGAPSLHWSNWAVKEDDAKHPTATLGNLLRHVRNAVAHGRIMYSSDSPRIEDVVIHVEDRRPGESQVYWSAEIDASDLRTFCKGFLAFVEETLG